MLPYISVWFAGSLTSASSRNCTYCVCVCVRSEQSVPDTYKNVCPQRMDFEMYRNAALHEADGYESLRSAAPEQEPVWVLGAQYNGASGVRYACSIIVRALTSDEARRTRARRALTHACIRGSRIAAQQRGRMKQHIKTIFKATYRSNFPPLDPYRYTDDSGWGCMLRSAQMLMGNVCIRHLLGAGSCVLRRGVC
jgi:hypothetical protein